MFAFTDMLRDTLTNARSLTYMPVCAPTQIMKMLTGKRYNGIMTDIWSCGVILYAMVCGCLPFEDPVTKLLYQKITNDDFRIPRFVSSKASSLITGMLNKDPLQRLNIQQIRDHPFCRQNPQQANPGIALGQYAFQVDTTALLKTQHFINASAEEVRSMILNNKHNFITATYYLILKKDVESKGFSEANAPPTSSTHCAKNEAVSKQVKDHSLQPVDEEVAPPVN